jgi:hypothetical protein
MDLLERFPKVYCPTCKKTQAWFFHVLQGNAYLDHAAADILCSKCKTGPPEYAFRPEFAQRYPARQSRPRNPESQFKVTVPPETRGWQQCHR